MKVLIHTLSLLALCLAASCSKPSESKETSESTLPELDETSANNNNLNMSIEYWTLVEPVWDKISIYDGPERFLLEFSKAPHKSQTLFAAHWAQSEIMNGGLGQFFSNPTGVLAPEAVDAFREIGLVRCASILSDAMKFFGEPYPRDQKTRYRMFDRFYDEHGDDAIPFLEQEDAMATEIEEENGGFDEAADRYATQG